MTTSAFTNNPVMLQAARARAAALAARCVGDDDKDDDAEAEFARLVAIDFSAAMAGRDFVDNLITGGYNKERAPGGRGYQTDINRALREHVDRTSRQETVSAA